MDRIYPIALGLASIISPKMTLDSFDILTIFVVAFNLTIGGWHIFTVWRDHRNYLMLESLLMQICVQAYCRQHQPIWQAWAGIMGTMDVRVEGQPIRSAK